MHSGSRSLSLYIWWWLAIPYSHWWYKLAVFGGLQRGADSEALRSLRECSPQVPGRSWQRRVGWLCLPRVRQEHSLMLHCMCCMAKLSWHAEVVASTPTPKSVAAISSKFSSDHGAELLPELDVIRSLVPRVSGWAAIKAMKRKDQVCLACRRAGALSGQWRCLHGFFPPP